MAKAKSKAAKKAPTKKAAPKKAAPKKTAAPKQAGRSRAEKKTLVYEPKKTRADKPTIPIVDPVAKKARSERATVADKLIAKPTPDRADVKGDGDGLGWMPAGKGYHLTLADGKLVARNDKGKRLSSVPKELKDGDVADQLEGLRDWLAEHDRECVATVEQWMLRSLPVPRAVLQAVWADPAWRRPLENAVVVAADDDGGVDRAPSWSAHARAGLFRGVDPKKGVGVVDLDGETTWLAADRVAIPHPILLRELEAWRELVTQLGVTQGIAQLHRETHGKPASSTASSIGQFEDGKFTTLMQAIGKARSLGYKMRGGYATCLVWDGGTVSEARYWIGSDDPESETYTGALLWVDGKERGIPIASVGPVAFSEGMRMASAIYAARVVEKQAAS